MRGRPTVHAATGIVALALAGIVVGIVTLGDGGARDAWAQTSSCGNGVVEPGEDCDPPGSACGSPGGGFLCSSSCGCAVLVTTTTATSTTTTTVPPVRT